VATQYNLCRPYATCAKHPQLRDELGTSHDHNSTKTPPRLTLPQRRGREPRRHATGSHPGRAWRRRPPSVRAAERPRCHNAADALAGVCCQAPIRIKHQGRRFALSPRRLGPTLCPSRAEKHLTRVGTRAKGSRKRLCSMYRVTPEDRQIASRRSSSASGAAWASKIYSGQARSARRGYECARCAK
jgi:hypothetical protein